MTNREWVLEYPEKLAHVLDDFFHFGIKYGYNQNYVGGSTWAIQDWIDKEHSYDSYDELLRMFNSQ